MKSPSFSYVDVRRKKNLSIVKNLYIMSKRNWLAKPVARKRKYIYGYNNKVVKLRHEPLIISEAMRWKASIDNVAILNLKYRKNIYGSE